MKAKVVTMKRTSIGQVMKDMTWLYECSYFLFPVQNLIYQQFVLELKCSSQDNLAESVSEYFFRELIVDWRQVYLTPVHDAGPSDSA